MKQKKDRQVVQLSIEFNLSRISEWLDEIVWVMAVKKMRNFGLSLDKIAFAHKHVMKSHKELETYPDLEFFVAQALTSEINPYILVLSEGYADVASLADIELSKASLKYNDLLLISIKEILYKMGYDVKEPKALFDLTGEETELLDEIRLGGNSEIKVKTHRGGEIKEIETTEVTTKSPQNYKAHNSAKKQKMYGRVTTEYENGKPRSTSVTKRKRFNK